MNMTGSFVVFKIEQASIRKAIKRQIKSGIPIQDLHEFVFSDDAYQKLDWVRPDKEFRIGKEMFDVVRTEKSGNANRLFCVNDKEEAILFAQLEEITQKKLEQESHSPNSPITKVVKILKLVYITFDCKRLLNIIFNKQIQTFSGVDPIYVAPYLKVASPPPNTV